MATINIRDLDASIDITDSEASDVLGGSTSVRPIRYPIVVRFDKVNSADNSVKPIRYPVIVRF
ncbi:hypothetical protein NIES2101_37445 [Calothrix sp. HK-06]|nr:hypothetical protein NIES2101_37445 [Calothrix sp. HK-06]